MNFNSSRRNIISFGLLFLVALAFTICSIWIISGIKLKRGSVSQFVSQIVVITNFEEVSVSTIESTHDSKREQLVDAFNNLVQFNFEESRFPDLKNLAEQTRELKKFNVSANDTLMFPELRMALVNIYKLAAVHAESTSQSLLKASEELDEMWHQTFILMVLACFIAILLVVVGLIIYRSNKKINNLKNQNVQIMKSLSDCVIVCDINGLILEFNKTACELFGYTHEEAIGKNISELYGYEEDWIRVKSSMDLKGSFQGEIVNVKKNEERFVSFLSSNIVFDEGGNKIGTLGISRDISEQKRSEEQFTHIIDNATDIIYTTDIHGNLTFINASGVNILGYSKDEFENMSFKKLIHPDYLESVEEFYNNQFRKREGESYLECKMIKADGKEIWIGQNVITRFSPSNPKRIMGFFGILRNLDAVKGVELRLQKSEAKYRELFDNSKDLIQSVDSNGNFLYVNQSWKDTLGYSEEALSELNIFDILNEECKQHCEKLFEDILDGNTLLLEDEHLLKINTKDGEIVIVKGTISVRYEQGKVKSLQTFLRDVTEQHAVELALMKSEETLRLIGKSINDVFFLYDISTSTYDFISPKCEDVLGAKDSFFMNGGNYTEVHIHPEDRKAVDDMNIAVRNGKNGHVEYRRKLPTGEIRWVDEKWFPIKDLEGNVTSISGICRDITDIKAAYDTILNQNREISQSILYAKNIQESTLPTHNEVKKILPNSFEFYKAKDVLSGDLYLIDKVGLLDGTRCPTIVVGDCTGHGVPGGLLSLLCNGLLTESLTASHLNTPAEALDFVREKLIRLFRSNPSKYILDGMDAAFCIVNYDKMEMYFAGANLSCYIVRNKELIEYKGDKQHIGYSSLMAPFVHHCIKIETGDNVYLTTDGYIDQFGGAKSKKFLRKRFMDLIVDMSDLPMHDQGSLIEENFYKWKGSGEQTDDIAMVGWQI